MRKRRKGKQREKTFIKKDKYKKYISVKGDHISPIAAGGLSGGIPAKLAVYLTYVNLKSEC